MIAPIPYKLFGPGILVRTISETRIPDKFGNYWQYHSRSDRHSKVACWGIIFDLLQASATIRGHVSKGSISFGINHEMKDFRANRKKNLDLVICTPRPGESTTSGVKTFFDLAEEYGIRLTSAEQTALQALPDFHQTPVGSVRVALEAKACMTAHVKALPRLYDELTSSHLTVHASSEDAIAAGIVMINFAGQFLSTDQNKFRITKSKRKLNLHKQPDDAMRVVEKVSQIPRKTTGTETGFDALAIVIVDGMNDASPFKLLESKPAPLPGDTFHYGSMIDRMVQAYESRFRDR